MIKVYRLDLTLAYILDHAVCCASAGAGWGRTLHLIISQYEEKFVELSEPMFGEVKLQIKNEL